MSTAKYKLYSSATLGDDGLKPPCAFFFSDKGCRNGDNCKFAHTKPGAVDDTMVSSESSDDDAPAFPTKKDAKKKAVEMESLPNASKRRKRVGDLFSKPKQKKQKESTEDSPCASPKTVKTPKEAFQKLKNPPKQQKTRSSAKQQRQTPNKSKQVSPSLGGSSDFRSLNLPVASFTMGGSAKAVVVDSQVAVAEDEKGVLPTILPTSTEVGRKWLSLVQDTRKHPLYTSFYDLQKYKDADEAVGYAASTWVKTVPFDDSKASNPQAIAIDCEMCETQDPVSGYKDPRALCRISVVDVETDEVLLDSLVKPTWPVSDYRTWINGIGPKDLENVQFTLRHAQAFMMALCSEETVMMGHSLHNDLAAMRMDHPTMVDSVCLYKLEGRDLASVSLKHLAKHILNIHMPRKHDSVNDARIAFQCLEHYRKKDGKVGPLKPAPGRSSKLFVHRLPKQVEKRHLESMFKSHADVAPVEIEDIVFVGDYGKTHAVFTDKETCDMVFDKLDQPAGSDTSGRLQKRVYLRGKSYIRVRKMHCEPRHETKVTNQNKQSPQQSD